MLSKFKKNIEDHFSQLTSAKIFLAISGGKDSMTLSHLLNEAGLKHCLLHCNFHLRGKESDTDEQFLLTYASAHQLEIFVNHFDAAKFAEEEGMTIQEAARKLRYDWFDTFLQDHNAYLLTAHHLDDSIETFFINLFRGTGYRGLAGIPPRNGKIMRPLFNFTAEEIYRYIDQQQVEYRSDSTNAKKDYQRNKIRHDLMPELHSLEPLLHGKMENLFSELNELKDYFNRTSIEYFNEHATNTNGKTVIPLNKVLNLHPFLRQQIFYGHGIHRKNVSEFEKFLQSNTGAEFIAGNHRFLIDRDQLIFSLSEAKPIPILTQIQALPVELYSGKNTIRFEQKEKFSLIKNFPSIQQVDFHLLKFPLTLRNWQQGDKMQPLGMQGKKLISDVLIDKKISRTDKENQLVLEDASGEIIALIGLAIADSFKITEITKAILEVQIV
ncbi:MAG: tRNA lysidine(34) synthetase TilS [Crocinitomicaceae bacterium]|nr:tRNA lysidine(34) synthetase TilS [Crocinitomicaceae bacterium]MBK8926038.1 tRNA lysidine(34) synthetase TilS [Crocinitomicaceae bacterium]